MAQLAIKGHSTRGKEVIEILEMLGGVTAATKDFRESYCYYISEDTTTKYISWDYISPEEIEKYKIFTLEEFLEKYPFKVGDKVLYTKFGDNCDDYPVTIESMRWTGTTIEYTFDGCVTCLTKDLKLFEEKDKAKATPEISTLNMSAIDYNNGLIGYEIPAGYEFDTVIDNKVVLKKLKPYPKTYEECCATLGYENREISFDTHTCKFDTFFENFYKLLICRDAYWKIAGEQMGLDKPWKPDWKKANEIKYCIVNTKGNITKWVQKTTNKILAFSTEEMRDAFYDNFKDLIEECKELL